MKLVTVEFSHLGDYVDDLFVYIEPMKDEGLNIFSLHFFVFGEIWRSLVFQCEERALAKFQT